MPDMHCAVLAVWCPTSKAAYLTYTFSKCETLMYIGAECIAAQTAGHCNNKGAYMTAAYRFIPLLDLLFAAFPFHSLAISLLHNIDCYIAISSLLQFTDSCPCVRA